MLPYANRGAETSAEPSADSPWVRASREAKAQKPKMRELDHAKMPSHEISAGRRLAGDLDRHRASCLCLRSGAGEAVYRPGCTHGPVADLYFARQKRLCRRACRMES